MQNKSEKNREIKPIYARCDSRPFLIRWGEKLIALISTTVLWIFLAFTLYNKLYVEAGESLQGVLAILGLGLLASVLALGLWQLYNWLRFHNKARRKEFRRQSMGEVGALYGISAQDMELLQEVRKAAVVEFRNHRYYYCLDGGQSIEIGTLNKN